MNAVSGAAKHIVYSCKDLTDLAKTICVSTYQKEAVMSKFQLYLVPPWLFVSSPR